MLDAGCGVGVLGVAVAAASAAVRVRCQDRDELARSYTAHNASINHIPRGTLGAHTEALLSCPEGSRWDLILSNVPAKAGDPVLRDFVRRSLGLLSPEGAAAVVVVAPLADRFRSWMAEAGARVIAEEAGAEHRVFIYGPSSPTDPCREDWAKCYLRQSGSFSMEETSYRMETFHGIADFDQANRAVLWAAKLCVKKDFPSLLRSVGSGGRGSSILVHEPDQGHFPAWLLSLFSRLPRHTRNVQSPQDFPVPLDLVLGGRNALALEAARRNSLTAAGPMEMAPRIRTVPAVDLAFYGTAFRNAFDLVVAFPEIVPLTDRYAAQWEGLEQLLRPGGIGLFAFPSVEAERLDRKKPKGFIRQGELKRDGFRALAYRKEV